MLFQRPGPITGNERLLGVQNGIIVDLNRTQLLAMMQASGPLLSNRGSYAKPGAPNGEETFIGIQDGYMVILNVEQVAAMLATTGPIDDPNPRAWGREGPITGIEAICGQQGGARVLFNRAEFAAVVGTIDPPEMPDLVHLELDDNTHTQGSPAVSNILNALAGADVQFNAGSLPAGMSYDDEGPAIVGTPSSAGTFNFSLVQINEGSPNSPLVTNLSIEIEPVGGALTLTGTLDPATWGLAFTDSLTIGNGAPPYTLTGLPPGMSHNVSSNTLSFTGTPL